MSKTIRIITEWVSTPGFNDMRAAVEHPYPGSVFSDVTGQADLDIPKLDINALVVEVAGADDKLLAELESDPNVTILWVQDEDRKEGTKDESATKQRRDAIKAALVGKAAGKDQAAKDAEIEARIKDAAKQDQLEAFVREYLKTQPATKERAKDDGTKGDSEVKGK